MIVHLINLGWHFWGRGCLLGDSAVISNPEAHLVLLLFGNLACLPGGYGDLMSQCHWSLV